MGANARYQPRSPRHETRRQASPRLGNRDRAAGPAGAFCDLPQLALLVVRVLVASRNSKVDRGASGFYGLPSLIRWQESWGRLMLCPFHWDSHSLNRTGYSVQAFAPRIGTNSDLCGGAPATGSSEARESEAAGAGVANVKSKRSERPKSIGEIP